MNFKSTLLFQIAVIIPITTTLVGCSDSDTKGLSVHEKITKYEMDVANQKVDELVQNIGDVKNAPESSIPSFQDQPIPSNFKKHHQEFGLDITTLSFFDPVEITTIKSLRDEYNQSLIDNPPQAFEDDGHNH